MTYQLPEHLQNYFEGLNTDVQEAYEIAKQARKKGFDPSTEPEIQIAKNMAERVVGLVSVLAPQIVDSGVVERIIELEQQYNILDWRVAFTIALEVAQQKYCSFTDEREAMEVGVRVGFAYATNGVVSSPLEGFSSLELIKRRDQRGEFFRLNYAGPIRNAGGTAAAVSVLIADYVRKHMGYAEYDPTEDEVKRCYSEIGFYHERVANLQYYPSEEEMDYLVRRMPVEVAGDPSEKYDVPNYKNLPRIPTNKLRSGYCLIYSSCIPLKAPKLWKQLSKWAEEMDMQHWDFLEEFIEIQHQAKAKSATQQNTQDTENKVTPVYTYIKDLVAGRPVFAHPMRPGGFRLRYGRSRLSGLSGQSLHPATMIIVNEFIATGSQLKVERPGKAAAYTPCDEIEGPIVRLKNGDVLRVTSSAQARNVKADVEKILYLGDVLINYGDFLDRAHPLIPCGYCEEWWFAHLVAAGVDVSARKRTDSVSFQEAKRLSEEHSIPLHPRYTYFYSVASVDQLRVLQEAILSAPQKERLILTYKKEVKEVLEVLGVAHKVVQEEYLVFGVDDSQALRTCFSQEVPRSVSSSEEFMKQASPLLLQDKAGTFIGARLGRPEKAKMRKLTGSPHALFPVGEEGGRLRSFNEAIQKHGKITSTFKVFNTPSGELSVLPLDIKSGSRLSVAEESPQRLSIDIRPYVNDCLTLLGWSVYPDLIKGVRGMVADERAAEHLVKGFLRAHHDICVNKDGTVRYDASEVPVTHFRCEEVGISVEQVKALGYVTDIYGKDLVRRDQVIEMFPQDVILPACDDSPEEKCDSVLLRVAQFIDDLLTKVYGLPAYYKASSPNDLVGKHVIALAPHTSAGTIGRIIGFSKTQGLYYHPYLHCATRRDCDGDEGCVFLALDAFLNFSKEFLPSSRGGTMDAPLVLTTTLVPAEVDDMVFQMDTAWQYSLDFYEACLAYKMPWEVNIQTVEGLLGTPQEFFGLGFTHDTCSMNDGNLCSAYKTLPTMQDKLESQMNLAEKIVAVDEADVAKLVINKHFIRDLKGNLRKFSMQQFRCVKCNEKFRRPPIRGHCTKCKGKIIFTISEGSVVKYLEPAESLIRKYDLDLYTKQTIDLTRRRVEEVFGKDPEKQLGLGSWFG
ncbi:MAG: DNA polymerase II large subunit [Candidatus Woesearchaeota archaeon]